MVVFGSGMLLNRDYRRHYLGQRCGICNRITVLFAYRSAGVQVDEQGIPARDVLGYLLDLSRLIALPSKYSPSAGLTSSVISELSSLPISSGF